MYGNGCERRTARCANESRLHGNDGAALVEMALLVPILAVLLFGIIEFGYLMSFRGGLAQAASEGARAAATAPNSGTVPTDRATTAANQALANYSKTCNVGATTCTFDIHDCSGIAQTSALPDCMTVTIRYNNGASPVVPSVPIISFAIPNTLTVSSTVELNDT
jgi:Flp pilus assembly protein TadG